VAAAMSAEVGMGHCSVSPLDIGGGGRDNAAERNVARAMEGVMKRKGRKEPKLAKALAEAIRRQEFGGESRYGLARRSGVNQSQLSRLVRGLRPAIEIGTAERLADAMGYEIVLQSKRS
jgi:hypothetical protein